MMFSLSQDAKIRLVSHAPDAASAMIALGAPPCPCQAVAVPPEPRCPASPAVAGAKTPMSCTCNWYSPGRTKIAENRCTLLPWPDSSGAPPAAPPVVPDMPSPRPPAGSTTICTPAVIPVSTTPQSTAAAAAAAGSHPKAPKPSLLTPVAPPGVAERMQSYFHWPLKGEWKLLPRLPPRHACWYCHLPWAPQPIGATPGPRRCRTERRKPSEALCHGWRQPAPGLETRLQAQQTIDGILLAHTAMIDKYLQRKVFTKRQWLMDTGFDIGL